MLFDKPMYNHVAFEDPYDIEGLLCAIQPYERVLVKLRFAIGDPPDDYEGFWPPTLSDIGRYASRYATSYASRSLTEHQVRHKLDAILARLRRTANRKVQTTMGWKVVEVSRADR
jgi:hypothetical protein